MGMDFYVRGFANGMARLCHRGGTTLPSWWHDFAIVVARLCHRGGTTLPSHWQNFATMMAKKQEKTN